MVTDVRTTTEVLKVLAEPARWRIVELLRDEDLCVCHLVDELELAQPLVSHHLRALRDAGIVEPERYKQWVYYRLRREAITAALDDLRALQPTRRRDRRRPCC